MHETDQADGFGLCLGFFDASPAFALVEVLELLDVFLGELHRRSRGIEAVLDGADRIEVGAGVELQAIIPVILNVALNGLIAAEDELRLVGVAVLVHGVKHMFKTRQGAGKSEVEGQEKLLLREVLKFVCHR